MTWVSKTWSDRVSQYPTRRLLVKADSSMEQVTVQRDEGTITTQGDSFTAVNMNNLEGRIGTAIAEVCTADAYASLHTTAKEIVSAINEVAANIAPEYNEEIGYTAGQLCRYLGVIYSAKYDIAEPAGQFDAQKWESGSIASNYMHSENPTGTGSFSMGRSQNTQDGGLTIAYYGEASGQNAVGIFGRGVSKDSIGIHGTAIGEGSIALNGLCGLDSDHAVAFEDSETHAKYAFAMGKNNEANGNNSTVFGHMNIAKSADQFVIGRAATEDSNGDYVLQVGNGTITEDQQTHAETVTLRRDAMTVDWSGNVAVMGNVTISGTPSSPNHAARLADVNKSLTEQTNITAVEVPANTATNVHHFNLDAGVYALHVVCRCSGGSQGRRHLALYSSETGNNFYGSVYFTETEANAIGSESVTLNLVTFVSIANNQSPIYIRVTSGSAVTVTPRVQYYKIG